jgi:hypothetical protein
MKGFGGLTCFLLPFPAIANVLGELVEQMK